MHKVKDLCVVTRTYTKNGKDKNVWRNVGSIYVNDDGQERYSIDAFFNFSALRQDNTDRVWLTAFPPRQKDNQQNSNNNYDGNNSFDANAALDDDLPF